MAAPRPPLTIAALQAAFRALDSRLEAPVTLIVGGGTAMMLAYGLPVRTTDVDAYPVMKCFAGREKDVGHARALLRRGPDLSVVQRRIEELVERGVPGALDAADFLDDLRG